MPIIDTFIAGVKFYPGVGVMLRQLAIGTELRLETDPNNKFDPTAVKIFHKETHVGHIPAFLSEKVTNIINEDRFEKIKKDEGVLITIYYRDAEAIKSDQVLPEDIISTNQE